LANTRLGHLKTASLESLVIKSKATGFPKENLYPITLRPNKHKEMAREHVALPLSSDDRNQSIKTLAHIYRPIRNENLD